MTTCCSFAVIFRKISFTNCEVYSILPFCLFPKTPLNVTISIMPKGRATLLEVIPKRGEMYQIRQFPSLSKQNVNNPCYPESRSQIPAEPVFLAVSRAITVCALISCSQIFIAQRRHSYFPCLWKKENRNE